MGSVVFTGELYQMMMDKLSILTQTHPKNRKIHPDMFYEANIILKPARHVTRKKKIHHEHR